MKKVLSLGLGHGLNDCISGFLLAGLFQLELSNFEIGIAFLMYNVAAFGGQLPLAWIIRKKYNPKALLISCYALHLAALGLFAFNYKIAILAIGFASAIIHVVGGYESDKFKNRASEIGLFASPGILGLVIGGYCGALKIDISVVCYALALGLMILSFTQGFEKGIPSKASSEPIILARHDIIMILLLTAISLRSAIWNIFQYIHDSEYEVLLYIGIAAMSGKLLGGFLADKIGLRSYSIAALLLSIPFLSFLNEHLWALLVGIFLLQSTFPATSKLIINHFKYNTLLGVALAFGFSIFIGALVFYTPLKSYMGSNLVICGLILLCCVFLFIQKRKISLKE